MRPPAGFLSCDGECRATFAPAGALGSGGRNQNVVEAQLLWLRFAVSAVVDQYRGVVGKALIVGGSAADFETLRTFGHRFGR